MTYKSGLFQEGRDFVAYLKEQRSLWGWSNIQSWSRHQGDLDESNRLPCCRSELKVPAEYLT